MTVAYQSGLETMAAELRAMGFDMVPMGEAAEACIFRGTGGLTAQSAAPGGVLMVEVSGRTAASVAHILQSRLYSPLFGPPSLE